MNRYTQDTSTRQYVLSPVQGLDSLCIFDVARVQPLFHVIQHCHRDRSDHGDLLAVVLEDEDHVKVLEAELDTLEMNKFDILECGDERRPGGKVNLNKTYYNNLLDFDGLPILTKQLEVG